jgi:hypothetical protein
MFNGAGDELVAGSAAVFNGSVIGYGDSTLELGAASAGSLYLKGFAGIVIDLSANWALAGYDPGASVTNNGVIVVDNGNALTLGAVYGGGAIYLGGNGVADFTGAVASGQTLTFTDAYGTLQLADPSAFAARISGFQSGDVIELLGIAADKYKYAKGKLTLTDDGSKVAVLHFAGDYGKRDFSLTQSGGNTYIMTTVAATSQAAAFFQSG